MSDPKKAAQKTKRDLIISGVLLTIFAFSFTKNVLMRKTAAPPPSSVTAAAPAASQSSWMTDHIVYTTNLRSYDSLRASQEVLWEKEWGRDPFVPLATFSAITKAVNLTLGGIFWDETNPKAIVNGKTLFNGDAIYGYTVDQIKPRSVVLKTGEKTIELGVFHPVVDANSD